MSLRRFYVQCAWREIGSFGHGRPVTRSIALSLLAAIGAWGLFVALGDRLGWQASALLGTAYFVVMGALPAAWIEILRADVLRLEAERNDAARLCALNKTMVVEARHRHGNNLGMASAMLNIESRHLDDRAARRAIERTAERIGVMADIERMLADQAAPAARIDNAFVRELVSRTIRAAGAEDRVRGQTFVQPVDMPQDILLPLALIINECVANAVEHGFPGDGRGEIVVQLEALAEESNAYQLTVADNGQGFRSDFDPANAPSLGLAFINAFAIQLGGAFRLQAGRRGAVALVTFRRG